MKAREECRCGSAVDAEDEDRRHVLKLVAAWRTDHRCMPADEKDRGRTGVGFAAAETVGPSSVPAGHNELDVIAGGSRA